MKNKSKKIILVIGITILLVTLGIVMPLMVKGDNNNAGVKQVLSGKTFTSGSLVASNGEMTDYSKLPLQTVVLAENANGVQTLELQPGYYESIQIDASALYEQAYNAGLAAGATTHTDTYTASSRSSALDLGVNHSYRYINTNSVPNTNSGTYTYASGSTGGTIDMGATNTYRYVNAANVYAKGKTDGAAAGKSAKIEVYVDRSGYTYKVRLNGKEVAWAGFSNQTWMNAGTFTV